VERTLRVVVIDDDPTERGRLLHFLSAMSDIDVVGALTSDQGLGETIRRLAPDVIFLETQLRTGTGFDVVSGLDDRAFIKLVFVTREPAYAIRGFEVGALDYIIKPVRRERVERVLARARDAVDAPVLEPYRRLPRGRVRPRLKIRRSILERFPVKEGDKVHFVKASDIDWIEAAQNYVLIHVGEASHLVRRNLGHVEAELDPDQFVRIHRSTIVNLDRVREIQPGTGRSRMVLLESGLRLPASRRFYRQLVLRCYAYRGKESSMGR